MEKMKETYCAVSKHLCYHNIPGELERAMSLMLSEDAVL
jgi:hypothetical protein